MKTLSPEELTAILAKHRRWLDEEEGGERADLRDTDLRFQDLRGERLLSALLTGSDFTCSDLAGAGHRNAGMFGTDLTDVDASLADMRGTNLAGARLQGLAGMWLVTGNRSEIKALQVDSWDIAYTATHMQIDGELHPLEKRWVFTDEEISNMFLMAPSWRKAWKPILQRIVAASPAVPGCLNAVTT